MAEPGSQIEFTSPGTNVNYGVPPPPRLNISDRTLGHKVRKWKKKTLFCQGFNKIAPSHGIKADFCASFSTAPGARILFASFLL